jgi:hypothetical protein
MATNLASVTRLIERSLVGRVTKAQINLAVVFPFSNIQRIFEKPVPRMQLLRYFCEASVMSMQGGFDADCQLKKERSKKEAKKKGARREVEMRTAKTT